MQLKRRSNGQKVGIVSERTIYHLNFKTVYEGLDWNMFCNICRCFYKIEIITKLQARAEGLI